MAIRNSKPLHWSPTGLSDSVDGTNVFNGAMSSLSNLIPDPSTARVWVCRPAAVSKHVFGGFTTPGFQSGMLVVGDIEYGMIASARNAGKDEPYAYNLSTGAFLTVSGITNGNTPTSPATSGDWVPPILAQVGGRIVVCHPGFPGGATKFGWFDVSGFSSAPVGNTANGSFAIWGDPTILGIQPGMAITGTNIPANTTVVSTAPFTLTTTGNTHSNTTLDNLAVTTGIAFGQTVTGNGIPTGTTVTSIVGTVVTLSQAATSTLTGVSVTFGGAIINISAAMTGGTNGVTFLVFGGTKTAPQWGAGDTNVNNLVSVPLGVAQFNGRAYFALGPNGIQYSDSGFACQISNNPNVQALLPSNGLPVTAIGPLQLTSLTGGVVQSLIAFQGAAQMQQITGDPTTTNLAMNSLPVATGTLAPLSISSCSLGLAFIAPDGLRIIDFSARVSDPVGIAGSGVVVPFQFSVNPSRICAASNGKTIRISVINGKLSVSQTQEYWYDLARKSWSGPHTFPASLIQPWGSTFVMSASGINAKTWQSDSEASLSSTYTENGTLLSWNWQTVLLPDNASGAMNAMVEATISMALGLGFDATVVAMDENGAVLDQLIIGGGGPLSIWGTGTWGTMVWGARDLPLQQRAIPWHQPIVFKQASIQVSAFADYSVRIGNLYMRHEILGYQIAGAA